MRVQVSALRVDMAESNLGAERDVGKRVGHAATPERVLELRAHEAITLTRVGQDEEVDAEHGHVEDHGDENQADSACDEVLDPEAGRDA